MIYNFNWIYIDKFSIKFQWNFTTHQWNFDPLVKIHDITEINITGTYTFNYACLQSLANDNVYTVKQLHSSIIQLKNIWNQLQFVQKCNLVSYLKVDDVKKCLKKHHAYACYTGAHFMIMNKWLFLCDMWQSIDTLGF